MIEPDVSREEIAAFALAKFKLRRRRAMMVWHPAAKQLEIIAELSNAQTFPAKIRLIARGKIRGFG
jgi:hypothetical protein